MAHGHDWREGREPASKLPEYPPDHKLGMEVPVGGSACSKCEYLNVETKRDCREPHFVQWNSGHHLPAPANRYCCDFFEERK